MAKVASHLQSAYAAELCGGLGVLSSVEQIMDRLHCTEKIDIILGSDCQSAIYKFSSMQRVVSFNSKLSCEVRELLRLKNRHVNLLTTCKIVGHQDRVKQWKELTFEERINIMCDLAAKELIREQIRINGSPNLPFLTHSPRIFNKNQQMLALTDSM